VGKDTDAVLLSYVFPVRFVMLLKTYTKCRAIKLLTGIAIENAFCVAIVHADCAVCDQTSKERLLSRTFHVSKNMDVELASCVILEGFWKEMKTSIRCHVTSHLRDILYL
jgi:hypothetical protein